MNKLKNLLGFLVLLPLLGAGADQDGAEQDGTYQEIPPPRAPLLHNAVAPASWTITAKLNDGQPEPKSRYLTQQTVAKGSQIRGIVSRWSDGISTECWVADGLNLSGATGSSDILVIGLQVKWQEGQRPYVDYRSGDFPELSWISLGNYAGIRPYQGKKCYFFDMNGGHEKGDSAKPKPGAPAIMDKTAYVDVATHLPVSVNDGVFTREYVFATSASEPIMPDNFAAQLKSIQQATAALYRH